MPEAVRVGDITDHSMPIQGSGSPDVFIGGQKAWRALPAGVGKGLDEASTSVKKIMDKPPFTPPEVLLELPKIATQMNKVAAQAEAAGATGASATVAAAFTAFATQVTGLAATYTAGAAVPGGEPAARAAFTLGFQTGLSKTMSDSVKAIAGPWDMHTCMQAGPAGPHGPGVVIEGEPTIFINNLPVVAKGHKVVEAAGGVSTVQMGCGTVFFGTGRGGSSGGGGGGGGASSTRPVSKKSAIPAETFPDLSGLGGGPVVDPHTGQPVLLAANENVPGLLVSAEKEQLTFPKPYIDRLAQRYKEAALHGKQCMGCFLAGMKGLFGDEGFQTHKSDKVIADVLPRLGNRGRPTSSAVRFSVIPIDQMGNAQYQGAGRPSSTLHGTVGADQGWSVFALSIGAGYHVVTVVVNTDSSAPEFYWFDQTTRGAVTADRVDEKVLKYTQQVVDKREPLGKGYDLTLGITRVVPGGPLPPL